MITTIIFDLGAVLIDWHPKHLYRKLFTTEAEIDDFLANICTSAWNEEQDSGRPIKEGTEWLVSQHPEHEAAIRAFYGRWDEMLNGTVPGMIELFKELKESGRYKLYALSNWSAETWPIALNKYELLQWFDGLVISGLEGIRKPAPEFYKLLLDRYGVEPAEALFIDDNYRNILAARELEIASIHFTSAGDLKKQLELYL
ncbi:HAD family hydrolase [Mucilaginibacter sp. PPCGB 2223]|uniref:HAD family hydrolase n=1 Tax=Mucilaginibacter sp. PPCGB 2223 TaxID=1886027 RepID=UPI0008251912|nr:HAD family phosphatase [Mucilaginibacter sp. PPCGB 2223]OCX51175.1 HAD family hydrolase [Mucilaginibacter sp. PPCGB 2223]